MRDQVSRDFLTRLLDAPKGLMLALCAGMAALIALLDAFVHTDISVGIAFAIPLMLAAPASFLSAGGVGTPGAGGTGGIGGTKFPRSGTQETPDPAGKGGDAPAGSAGATALLQWYP